jgi:formyl-CoA transferase
VEWVQDPALLADPSLADEAERHARRDFILDRLESWAEQFPKDELVAEAQRRHIPASPVATPLDLVRDPQLVARGFLKEMAHPLFGRRLFPLGAIAAVRGTALATAPTLGQHNAEVLGEPGQSDPAAAARTNA